MVVKHNERRADAWRPSGLLSGLCESSARAARPKRVWLAQSCALLGGRL